MSARVFQVAYDQGLLRIREFVLTEHGFSVASAFGNEEACRLLAESAPFDAFLIGWCSTYEKRNSIVHWLKQRWPVIPVVALHNFFQGPVPEADITATYDSPQEWIAAVKGAAEHKK